MLNEEIEIYSYTVKGMTVPRPTVVNGVFFTTVNVCAWFAACRIVIYTYKTIDIKNTVNFSIYYRQLLL